VARVAADGTVLWASILAGQSTLESAFALETALAVVSSGDGDTRLTTLLGDVSMGVRAPEHSARTIARKLLT
jgi:hypothetical protein